MPRNIPAYAGKTHPRYKGLSMAKEHPRVCGENGVATPSTGIQIGTSPRMRGKPGFLSAIAANPRNIPAYAGKTNIEATAGERVAEHPRVCGENSSSRFWKTS